MIVGCYSMDLYCDGATCRGRRLPVQGEAKYDGERVRDQFTGPNLAYASRVARQAGWKLDHKGSRAWCPHCSTKAKA